MEDITVKCYVDKQSAILAGKDRYGEIAFKIKPSLLTEAQRHALTLCDTGSRYYADFLQVGAEATQETVVAALEQLLRREEEEKRKKQEEFQRRRNEYLSQEDDQWISTTSSQVEIAPFGKFYLTLFKFYDYFAREYKYLTEVEIDGVKRRLQPIIEERNAEVIETARLKVLQKQKEEQEEKEEKERVQQEKQAQIEAWLKEYGSDNQQGRYKLGALPVSEVEDAIREQAYASLADFTRYSKIRLSDIEHGEDCYQSQGLECDVVPLIEMTAEEYDIYSLIQEKAPAGATLEALEHSCQCEECQEPLSRNSVKVELNVGLFHFSREYAL